MYKVLCDISSAICRLDGTLVPSVRYASYLFDENQRHERKMGMNHNLYFGQWAVALLEVGKGVPQAHAAILQPRLFPIFPSSRKVVEKVGDYSCRNTG